MNPAASLGEYGLLSGKPGDDSNSEVNGALTKVGYSDSTPAVTYAFDRLKEREG